MFKNQTTLDDKETNTPSEKDFKLENTMIHTMAKDIREHEHPDTQKQPIVAPIIREHMFSSNEKQKSSPFLTPELLNSQPPIQKAPVAEKEIPAVTKETPIISKEISIKQSNSFATTLIAIIAVALIAGAGFYYFNIIRQTEVAITEPIPETVIPTSEHVIPSSGSIIPVEPKFFTTRPNYLSLDIDNLTNVQIKELLNDYAEEVKAAELTEPAEFIITDLQNNPIDFTTFSQKIGVTLSKKVITNLDPAFSLFIFNDAGNVRLGLAILTVNDTALKSALLLEEPFLAKNLEAILLFNTSHKFLASDFEEVNYNGTIIRYQNIVSPEELSVDYALSNGQLLIGTTKNTMHAIIDKVVLSTDDQPSD